jgi:hypothetical protein
VKTRPKNLNDDDDDDDDNGDDNDGDDNNYNNMHNNTEIHSGSKGSMCERPELLTYLLTYVRS